MEAAAERSRVTVRARVERLRRLAPTLLLGAVAAGASWLIAKSIFGTTGAFFAPVAAIITLGLTVGQRLDRAIELSVGVPLGIALADVLVLEVGSGPVQLGGIVFLATAVAGGPRGGPAASSWPPPARSSSAAGLCWSPRRRSRPSWWSRCSRRPTACRSRARPTR